MSIDKREDDGPIIDKKDFAEDSTTTDLEGVLASVTEGGTLTQRELWGWWIWGWGVNGFGGSAQGVFIPVILSSLAVAASFRSDDPSQPCAGAENCIVRFGTMNVSPASFSLFNQGLAIAFQVVTFIQLGAIGDHGNYRKHLLFGCSLISQICCLLFIAVDSTGYQLAGIINIIANVFWGASWVFATSYLPLFAMLSPQVKRARQEGVPLHELVRVEQEVMSHISGRLILIAYTGGTVCFLIAAGAVLALRQTTYSLQVATAIGGGWWVTFGAVSWFLLTSRPSPPLPAGENYLTYPWKRLYRSLKTGHRLPDMTTILIANFFFSDARHTTISLAVLFAQFELKASNAILIVAAIVVNAVGALTIPCWRLLQRQLKLHSKTIIMTVVITYTILPAYILLGFIPGSPIGLKSTTEFIIIASYLGFVNGAQDYIMRSVFAETVPRGHESEMFGLFALTGQSGSWMGPLIVGKCFGDFRCIRDDTFHLARVIF
ncbi:autophagy-related protein 22-like protein, partial [Jimgerdemannia flammicorona]